METLTSYRALVQQVCDDTSAAATQVIDRALKDTYQEVLRQTAKYLVSATREDIPFVIGQNAYATANDPSKIHSAQYARGGNFSELHNISYDDYLKLFVTETPSTPVYWFVNGSEFNIAPMPSAAGTIRIMYRPIVTELVDTSIIPERYTKVMVDGATYRFKAYEDSPSSTEYKQWYHEGLRDMVLDLSNKEPIFSPKLY
jgi:hypothetical protein